MSLKSNLKPGDILLITPKNTIGKLIVKFTFGKVNHAAICYDSENIFETDGDIFKADFAEIEKYEGRDVFIVRANYIRDRIKEVKDLCEKYKGRPYSYWDIVTNALFFFLARPIRSKVVGLFGSKEFMVCSELVARIVYEATGNKIWKDFEGMTPEDIRDIALENPEEHSIFLYRPEETEKKPC